MSQNHECFAPAEILKGSEKGMRSPLSLMGGMAEFSIGVDYLIETLPLRTAVTTDWFDRGGRTPEIVIGRYADALLTNHPQVSRARLLAYFDQWKFGIPDILTFKGIHYAQPPEQPARRDEYYEIKPNSPTGLIAGIEKLAFIPPVYRRFGMAYQAGTAYPRANGKQVPLLRSSGFEHFARVLMRLYGIYEVRLYLSVQRERAGLIVYRLCLEIATEERRRRQKSLVSSMAKLLYAGYVIHHNEDSVRGQLLEVLKKELGPFELPRVTCTFDAIPTLKPQLGALEDAILTRGLGLPGEEYLLCADENYYKAVLAPRTPDHIGEIWTALLERARLITEFAGGPALWKDMKPYVLRIETAARELDRLFPGMKEAINAILHWIKEHPVATMAIVVAAVVITAGVAAFLEPALAAGGALVAATTVEATAAAGSSNVLGVLAAEQTLSAAMGASRVAAVAPELLNAARLGPALARIGGAGLAANDVGWTVGSLHGMRSAQVVKAGIGLAAGFAAVLQTTSAAGATAAPPTQAQVAAMLQKPATKPVPPPLPTLSAVHTLAVSTATAYGRSTLGSVMPTDPAIAQFVSGLHMVRGLASSRQLPDSRARSPVPGFGDEIDLRNWAEYSDPFGVANLPQTLTRYVGRVRLGVRSGP